jgi:hypothetical protein
MPGRSGNRMTHHERLIDHLMNLIEEMERLTHKYRDIQETAMYADVKHIFYERLNDLPYEEQMSFVGMLVATETISLSDGETILERIRTNHLVRQMSACSALNPHTSDSHKMSVLWDSLGGTQHEQSENNRQDNGHTGDRESIV